MNINADQYPLLDTVEEREMIIKAQSGNKEAINYMVMCNTPLVRSILKSYYGRGIEADDLFQFGVMGIMKSLKDFDVNKGVKFATYAHGWIKNKMSRAIKTHSRTIRLPEWVYNKNCTLIIASKKLNQELGRTATEKELAEYTSKTIDEINKFKQTMLDTCSMSELSDKNEEMELGDNIADAETDIAGEIAVTLTTNQMLMTIKEYTNEKEYKIFCMRNGLGCREHTFTEIAEEIGISKQGVQQAYNICLSRLKRNHKLKLYKVS